MLKNFEYMVEGGTFTTPIGEISLYFPCYTNALRKRSLESLDLSVRAYYTLKRNGVDTIQQLRAVSLDQLVRMRNIGKRSLCEIVEAVYTLTHYTVHK